MVGIYLIAFFHYAYKLGVVIFCGRFPCSGESVPVSREGKGVVVFNIQRKTDTLVICLAVRVNGVITTDELTYLT